MGLPEPIVAVPVLYEFTSAIRSVTTLANAVFEFCTPGELAQSE